MMMILWDVTLNDDSSCNESYVYDLLLESRYGTRNNDAATRAVHRPTGDQHAKVFAL